MLRHATRTSCCWAFDAGEVRMWATLKSYLRLAFIVLWIRLNQGHAVHCGMGVWGPHIHSHGNRCRAYGWFTVLCNIVAWRDVVTRSCMGNGQVQPDWAFMLGQPISWLCSERRAAGRDLLAVSMRGDRELPGDAWLAAVKAQAGRQQLKIVVVVQVAHDRERAVQLAALLGGECLNWSGDDHMEREDVVRAIYRRSRYIISDRLHALIIAMTEGALPVGYTVGSNEKVDRVMASAGIRDVTFSASGVNTEMALQKMADIENRAEELFAGLATARERLRRLAVQIQSLVTDGPSVVI